jgi:hypothetical protein
MRCGAEPAYELFLPEVPVMWILNARVRKKEFARSGKP